MALTRKFTDVPAEIKKVYEHGAKSNPFLALIGSLNGLASATSFEFTSSQDYQISGGDVSISEDGSITAPTADNIDRVPFTNVAQILQYSIDVSYARESDTAGQINLAGEGSSQSPLDFQVDGKMKQLNKDWNWASINGTKVVAANGATAFKMGGIYNLVATEGTNLFDNSGTPRALTKELIEDSLATAVDGGTDFENPAFLITAKMKQKINVLYGNAIESITEAGVNLVVVHTVAGIIRFVVDSAASATQLAIIDLSFAQPVVLPVKGSVMVIEPLGKAGAAERFQLYTQVSVDFGSAKAHAVISDINLAL
jgi:hypothetical protein